MFHKWLSRMRGQFLEANVATLLPFLLALWGKSGMILLTIATEKRLTWMRETRQRLDFAGTMLSKRQGQRNKEGANAIPK